MDARLYEYEKAAEQAALLPQQAPSVNANMYPATPVWMRAESSRRSDRGRRFRRSIVFTTGGLVVIYLLLCTWIAHGRNDATLDGEGFPNGKFPWPFPRHPPKHPHPHPPPHHPHHPFPHPEPTVLGCKPIPTPTDDVVSAAETVKLSVTIPKYRPVVLEHYLLHGNVSVSKIPEEEDSNDEELEENMIEVESEGKEITVQVTVVNRTEPRFPPPPSPPRLTPHGPPEDEESKGFLLCAITLGFPDHSPPPPPDSEEQMDGISLMHPPPPHPHRRPPPPVIVGIFPAHNETYPKLPGPPPGHPHSFPPHHGPMHEGTVSLEVTFKGAWRSILSFLFPMFSSSSSQGLDGQFPPSHSSRLGGHKKCPHGHPPHPPPFFLPPFKVVALEAEVPAPVPVIYGPPPPFFRHHRPPPPPHHPPHHPHLEFEGFY